MQEYADAQSLPASPSWIACFLPGSARWFFLWFMTLFLLFAPGYILGDGAVARHICTGIDIIEKGRIAHNNYVWAINPNEPWLTHELLGDIAFAASY